MFIPKFLPASTQIPKLGAIAAIFKMLKVKLLIIVDIYIAHGL